MKMRLLPAMLIGACFALNASAVKAEQIILEADKTIMINLADRPGTVVVGNPSIADVSINANTVFLHGHSFGNTNIIILDSKGEQIATFDVTIKVAQADAVTILTTRPAVNNATFFKSSYSCSPTCERSFQIMDNDFKEVSDSMKLKSELATGSKTSEASAPSAAQ